MSAGCVHPPCLFDLVSGSGQLRTKYGVFVQGDLRGQKKNIIMIWHAHRREEGWIKISGGHLKGIVKTEYGA